MGCIVVHAGLVPGVPLESQDANAMSCMRNVVESGKGKGYEPRVYAKEGARADSTVRGTLGEGHEFGWRCRGEAMMEHSDSARVVSLRSVSVWRSVFFRWHDDI